MSWNRREREGTIRRSICLQRPPRGSHHHQQALYLEQDKLVSVGEEDHGVLHGVVLVVLVLLGDSSV